MSLYCVTKCTKVTYAISIYGRKLMCYIMEDDVIPIVPKNSLWFLHCAKLDSHHKLVQTIY